MTRRIYLGIGSNLGDREAHLRRAVAALPDVVAVSQIYETEPVDGAEGQGAYLNAVVALESDIEAHVLLELAMAIEHGEGRVRTVRNGDRTLDIDILIIEGEVHEQAGLHVPHPRMWERRFVLVPLAELAPELVESTRLENAIGAVWPVGSL